MDGKVSITGGNETELIKSGSFITFNSLPTSLKLEYKNDIINLLLEFGNYSGEKGAIVTFNEIDQSTLRILFKNFTSQFGIFSPAPIHIGSIANRILFFSYFISSLGTTGFHKIDYSFYCAKEVPHG